MVALLVGLRWVRLVVVLDEHRVVLVGRARHEAVVVLEAAGQRPAVERSDGRELGDGSEVPLPHRQRRVAVLAEDLRKHAVLPRDGPVVAGEAEPHLGYDAEAVGVVVARRHEAGARRRAQRRGVHVVEPQPAGRQRIHVRRVDRCAEAAELGEPDIIQDHPHDVRRAGSCSSPLRPGRHRLLDRPADHAGEGPAELVQPGVRHPTSCAVMPAARYPVWNVRSREGRAERCGTSATTGRWDGGPLSATPTLTPMARGRHRRPRVETMEH